jgi:hypothetical protein
MRIQASEVACSGALANVVACIFTWGWVIWWGGQGAYSNPSPWLRSPSAPSPHAPHHKNMWQALRRHGQQAKPPLVIAHPMGFLLKSYTGRRAPASPPPPVHKISPLYTKSPPPTTWHCSVTNEVSIWRPSDWSMLLTICKLFFTSSVMWLLQYVCLKFCTMLTLHIAEKRYLFKRAITYITSGDIIISNTIILLEIKMSAKVGFKGQ